MKTVTFDMKIDAGDACYAIIEDKIMKCRVREVWVNYKNTELSEILMIEYCLVDQRGCPCGVWPESRVFATKEELIKHIESV